MFQSSPAPKDGRYTGCPCQHTESVLVSILARPEGRALLGRGGGEREIAIVSILARPEGRALPFDISGNQ